MFRFCVAACLLVFSFSLGAEQFEFKGNHFLASYNGCDFQALTDLEKLPEALLEASRKSGATVLDSTKYIFPPHGITMVVLLSESHASIHTYPEHGSCFVDLFTCGNKCSAEKFDLALREYLQPKEVNVMSLVRHQGIEEH